MKKIITKLRAIWLLTTSKGFYLGVVNKKEETWTISNNIAVPDAKTMFVDLHDLYTQAEQEYENVKEAERLIN